MKMCPEAKIDDGLLDITYVQNVPPEKVPEALQVLGGKKDDELSESIKTMRVPWLQVGFLNHDACIAVFVIHQGVCMAVLIWQDARLSAVK